MNFIFVLMYSIYYFYHYYCCCCCALKTLRDSSPKNDNYVINYLLSCRSKDIRPSLISGTQIKIILTEIQELSDPAYTAM